MDVNGIIKSISEDSIGEFKDKGSKFIAFAYPCNEVNKVQEFIQNLKKNIQSPVIFVTVIELVYKENTIEQMMMANRLELLENHFKSN